MLILRVIIRRREKDDDDCSNVHLTPISDLTVLRRRKYVALRLTQFDRLSLVRRRARAGNRMSH